jgi:hypothetical protein
MQGVVQQGWCHLQQCTDQGTAVLVLAQLLAQGRYGALRLLKVDCNTWCEPVDYQVLMVWRSGGPLSEIDTTVTTRELRATARRMRMMDALQQCAALAVIFVASVGLGVSITTL